MKWFKKLFKCSKKDELKEKTKTLSSDAIRVKKYEIRKFTIYLNILKIMKKI